MEELLVHLSSMKLLFDSEYVDDRVSASHTALQSAFKNLGREFVSADYHDDSVENEIELNKPTMGARPFGRYFEQRLRKINPCCDASVYPPNPLHNSEFVKKIVLKWLPTCPLWTSLFRGSYFIQINTNCCNYCKLILWY